MKKKLFIALSVFVVLSVAFTTLVIATKEGGFGKSFLEIFNKAQNERKVIASAGDCKIYDTEFDSYKLFYTEKTDEEIFEYLFKNKLIISEAKKAGITVSEEEVIKAVENNKKIFFESAKEDDPGYILLKEICDGLNIKIENYFNLDAIKDAYSISILKSKYYQYLLNNDKTNSLSKDGENIFVENLKNELYNKIKDDIEYYKN